MRRGQSGDGRPGSTSGACQEVVVLVDAKYRAGAAEHGGELLALPDLCILDLAIDEAIDQAVYLLSLKEKLVRRLK